jgi:hypothetical protein
MWLAQFSAQPLPDEADVSFSRLIANGVLLSRVAAALLKATQQGLSVVPAVPMRVGEAWEAAAGAGRAGRAADDAAAFVASCRAMGVRTVECCSALDVTNPGAASTKAVRVYTRGGHASCALFCVLRFDTRRGQNRCASACMRCLCAARLWACAWPPSPSRTCPSRTRRRGAPAAEAHAPTRTCVRVTHARSRMHSRSYENHS